MVMRLALFLGLLFWATVAVAKGLDARVDRKQVGLGEQIELTLTLTDIKGQRPDVNALLKDFSIDRQSQSTSTQIINGVVNQEASWTFLLSPNRKGKLSIPSFKIDRFSSDPIDITVTDMPVAQSTSDDVLMEVELTPANPYVQSQVAYVQRLFFSRPLVDSASISNPKLSQGDADIQFWGSSEPRYVTHNSRPYQLIERYYIIYPRKAGTLEFEPSVFKGSLASSRRRNDFQMNMFRAGTRVNAYSAKASIEVKAKPADYPSEHWLPATDLTVNINLSQPAEALKAGEPVTVTIALMAEGLKAEVLPEVTLDLPAGIKSYPEKPTFRTDKVRNGMVGLRQEKVVLIANEVGEYILPELKIPWWNVTEDKLNFAKLDPVVLKVALGSMPFKSKSENKSADASDATTSESNLDDNAGEKQSLVEEVTPVTSNNGSGSASYLNRLLELYQQQKTAINLGLLLSVSGLLVGWLFWRRRQARLNSSQYKRHLAVTEVVKLLKMACKNNDLESVISLLPKWAEAVGINPSTIAGIEATGDVELGKVVREMTAANYSKYPSSWNGKRLLKAISEFSAVSSAKRKTVEGLSPLHPVSS